MALHGDILLSLHFRHNALHEGAICETGTSADNYSDSCDTLVRLRYGGGEWCHAE
jgi:hypothetical protein